MSWISVWLKGRGKRVILNDLFNALRDGKITQAELQEMLVKVGLGVVNAGLPGQVKRAYQMTDPEYLRALSAKTVEDVIREIAKVHFLLGLIVEG